MSLSVVVSLAEPSVQHSEPLFPAWAVGALTLGILLALLIALLMFGAGRDHS